MNRKLFLFGAVVLASLLCWAGSLGRLLRECGWESAQGYITLVPFVAAALVWKNRTRVFNTVNIAPSLGFLFIGFGATLHYTSSLNPSIRTSLELSMVGLVIVFIGAFVLSYGRKAALAASFPMASLFLIVPLPELAIDRLTRVLQSGSALTTDALLRLSGIPFLRSGFTVVTPGRTIEIATECSGIRSALFLAFLSTIAAYLFLHATWTRLLLIASTLPISAIKNGLRIFTLVIFDTYVDPTALDSNLHRYAGIPFFAISLMLLYMSTRSLAFAENQRFLLRKVLTRRVVVDHFSTSPPRRGPAAS